MVKEDIKNDQKQLPFRTKIECPDCMAEIGLMLSVLKPEHVPDSIRVYVEYVKHKT